MGHKDGRGAIFRCLPRMRQILYQLVSLQPLRVPCDRVCHLFGACCSARDRRGRSFLLGWARHQGSARLLRRPRRHPQTGAVFRVRGAWDQHAQASSHLLQGQRARCTSRSDPCLPRPLGSTPSPSPSDEGQLHGPVPRPTRPRPLDVYATLQLRLDLPTVSPTDSIYRAQSSAWETIAITS
ncbi:hypothetical protein NDU88_004723 [Pleurodeles waltl]|uniref:Uncharacterized protein n=1 Tax=Pleurodeles waltl TaxID=8319 RepID=A0AAV7TTI5_PLEWA|nr:hypothetical protein NDU88_004723 [Pleurodeles waltl]